MGTPVPIDLESRIYFLKLKVRGSDIHPLVELGCVVAAEQASQHRLKWGSIKDSQHGYSVPLQASHGIPRLPDSRDGIAAQVREVRDITELRFSLLFFTSAFFIWEYS